MSETKEQVFEALLGKWREDEHDLIGEFSSNFDRDHAELAEDELKWRERFRKAQR